MTLLFFRKVIPNNQEIIMHCLLSFLNSTVSNTRFRLPEQNKIAMWTCSIFLRMVKLGITVMIQNDGNSNAMKIIKSGKVVI